MKRKGKRGAASEPESGAAVDDAHVEQPERSVEASESSSSTMPTSVFVGLATFAVYACTAYPSVSGGDSGELIVAACNFGVAHPPGYPTFTLLARLFLTLLAPLGGSPAWRVNMLSVTCGAIAAALIHATTQRLTRSNWAGHLSDDFFGA